MGKLVVSERVMFINLISRMGGTASKPVATNVPKPVNARPVNARPVNAKPVNTTQPAYVNPPTAVPTGSFNNRPLGGGRRKKCKSTRRKASSGSRRRR